MHAPIILPFNGKYPKIAESAFIAPGAVVIGDVEIGEKSNIWFGTIIRGDVHSIRIGAHTNIQDGCVVHVSKGIAPTHIGDNVTIGHKAVIHGCTLESASFVGMGAVVLDHAVVESGGMLAAGALLAPKKRIPKGELWAGNPARLFRPMTEQESSYILASAEHYVELAQQYINIKD